MSQRREQSSLAWSPCRKAKRIMVASRCGVRAPIRFCAVVIRRSTSSGVRYSRGRRSALERRRGGTFPFTVLGILPFLTRKPLCFIGPGYQTFPLSANNGTVLIHSTAPSLMGCSDRAADPSREGLLVCCTQQSRRVLLWPLLVRSAGSLPSSPRTSSATRG